MDFSMFRRSGVQVDFTIRVKKSIQKIHKIAVILLQSYIYIYI